jgi:hypothetical protein
MFDSTEISCRSPPTKNSSAVVTSTAIGYRRRHASGSAIAAHHR